MTISNFVWIYKNLIRVSYIFFNFFGGSNITYTIICNTAKIGNYQMCSCWSDCYRSGNILDIDWTLSIMNAEIWDQLHLIDMGLMNPISNTSFNLAELPQLRNLSSISDLDICLNQPVCIFALQRKLCCYKPCRFSKLSWYC